MSIPLPARIAALVLVTTAFYTYVGQMVPQREVQPPEEIAVRADLTTPEMVQIGREIMEGKGLCMTCHTIGQSGALRFPDLGGVAGRAGERIPGMSDVEYLAQSLYEPDIYIVEGFNPGMPAANRPPIGLTDQEILCVIAALQSLGGTPTVTLQTTHRYYGGPAEPGGLPAPPSAPDEPGQPQALPRKGVRLRPAVASPHLVTIASAGDAGGLRRSVGAAAILQPVVAHQVAARTAGRPVSPKPVGAEAGVTR